MGRVSSDNKQKSWSEINKIKKEERKKWKEQNLVKKIEKQKLKEAKSQVSQAASSSSDSVPQKHISTVSIAVPGSILENAQSPELRTYLSGQIARAACIFQVDEIVVFDDYSDEANSKKNNLQDSYGLKTVRECCVQLGRILQYLECPQYLRRNFFPIHTDLRFSGVLNPLNAPHHLSKNDRSIFREGVVLNKPIKEGKGSIVNVGLSKEAHVDKLLTPGLRCTVKLQPENETPRKLKGIIVPPSTPRRETGIYWGYTVRLAQSLSKVFSQCPYKEGYDVTIGTSDKGSSVDEFKCPSYEHLLIVFGGVHGIEVALETDTQLNVDDPQLLFDHYLNTLPNQGSKTIRTEEAILISLAAVRPKLNPKNGSKEFDQSSIEYCSTLEKSTSSNVDVDDMSKFD